MAILLDPVPHETARQRIADKPPVTRAMFDRLLPELKAAAFVITKVEDLHTIERVRNLVAEVPAGEDWDEQKAKIIDELMPWLQDEEAAEARAELLLRSHGFAAYSMANYRELEEMKDIFPWRKYQTAGDDRVRAAHAALDGVIAPASSPFWRSHTPPWDFGCRCDVVGLTDDDVEEIRFQLAKQASGSAVTNPEFLILEPGSTELEGLEQGVLFRDNQTHFVARDPNGFVFDPEGPLISVGMLQSMRDRLGPRLWGEFLGWAETAEVPGSGTVWDWLKGEWKALPKSVAPVVATASRAATGAEARTMLAALQQPLTDADREIDSILDGMGYTSARQFFDNNPDGRDPYPDLVAAYARRDAIIEQAREAVYVDPAAKRPFTPAYRMRTERKVIESRNKEALDLWAKMIGADVLDETNRLNPLQVRRAKSRSFFDPSDGSINMGPGRSTSIHMHEIGHWLEHNRPELLARSLAFFDRRTQGDQPYFLYPGELVYEDDFFNPYCGKVYKRQGVRVASEILTMGIERFAFDTVAFAQDDPDYFDFLFDTLRQRP